MTEVLEVVSSHGYLIAILAFVVGSIKAAVDFWFITELEKILMTDYQKLKGLFSKLTFTVLPSVVITFIYIITSDNILLIEPGAIDGDLLLIVLLIIIFILNILLHLAVLLLEYLFNIKSTFFLRIGEEDWSIERLTKDKHLLLANSKNEFLLIDDWKERKIKKTINKSSYTYKIYSNKSVWVTSLVLFSIIISLPIIIWAFTTHSGVITPLFFSACLAFIAILIVLVNLFEYRRSSF